MAKGGITMNTKTVDRFWQTYPESHLHCDVTMAGQQTYRIVVSLVTREGETLAAIEHYGSGNLEVLKAQAFEHLATKLQPDTRS
jgi:hypothetical protein